MSEKSKRGKKKRGSQYSGISDHKRVRKALVPPLMAVPGITLQSWVNDRLPEMLWAALLITALGRERALEKFRKIANFSAQARFKKRVEDPTLSALAGLE